MQRRVHLLTFGCQMNKLDSELVAGALREAGHEIVDDPGAADTILINTCAVRDQAENRVLSRIGTLKARKARDPRFRIGVLGCMAQRMGASLPRQYPQVDLVVGTRAFAQIAALLERAESGPVVAVDEASLSEAQGGALPPRSGGGLHSWVGVMRGCENYCAYCVVPYVRGREESRPLGAVVDEVRALVEAGTREVTLLGQSIDKYGRDLSPPASLAELLGAIDAIPGLQRLRFVTAHPKRIDAALFKVMASCPTICEFLHVPAQSGSDRMLERMNRGYNREHYERILQTGRQILPTIAYASDFIVGFPGETEADFLRTLDLVRDQQFQTIFAFRYSPRPGTRAARFDDDVPDHEKERRLQALLGAQEELNASRNRALVDSEVEVLVEGLSKRDATKLAGRTRQNALAVFPAPDGPSAVARWTGRTVRLRVVDWTPLTIFGEPVEQETA
jgi:tRNA-2-methylthio-N6-dimethylallyladenosine synthase